MNIKFACFTIETPLTVLAADIGASKTSIGIFYWDGSQFQSSFKQTVKSKSFDSAEKLICSFLDKKGKPDLISLAVAGPVLSGRSLLTNLHWEISSSALADFFQVPVLLINDLQAAAFGLAVIEDKEIHPLHEIEAPAEGNIAIISPGTGLGEAVLYYDGESYAPFATEGGHSSFAVRNELDFELYNYLARKYGHVSWERVVSGPGICDIYDFLYYEKDREQPAWLKEKLLIHDKATVISDNATECSICKEVMDMFIRFLAYESGNLVLKARATGGLLIGGGILPNILPLIHENYFLKHFTSFGRLKTMLEKVPIGIITNKDLSMLGAGYYAILDNKKNIATQKGHSLHSKSSLS